MLIRFAFITTLVFAASYVQVASADVEGFTSMTAVHSDALVDSIGIDTHLFYPSYNQTPYFYDLYIRPAILEGGFRHVHDTVPELNTEATTYTLRLKELSARKITFALTINPKLWEVDHGSNAYPSPLMNKLRAVLQGGVVNNKVFHGPINVDRFILGPNEYDHCPSSICGNVDWYTGIQSYRGDSWKYDLVSYNTAVYEGIKADPLLQNIPIWAVPLVHVNDFANVMIDQFTSLSTVLAPLKAAADLGNVHVYCHHLGPFACLDSRLLAWEAFYAGMPMWVSEYGLSSASHVSGVSDTLKQKLLPRTTFELFNRGIERSYIYELLDEGAANNTVLDKNYGLLNMDGSRKGSFETFKNLISILSDPTGEIQTEPLRIHIGNANVNLHHLLMMKQNGEYFLALWNELSNSTESDVRRNITLNFEQPKNVALFDPRQGSSSIESANSTTSYMVSVPDSVIIVRIADVVRPTPTPTPDVTSTPEPTQIPPDESKPCRITIKRKSCEALRSSISCKLIVTYVTQDEQIPAPFQMLYKVRSAWKNAGATKLFSPGRTLMKVRTPRAAKQYRLVGKYCNSTSMQLGNRFSNRRY